MRYEPRRAERPRRVRWTVVCTVAILVVLAGALAWRASHFVAVEAESASGVPALSEWAYFDESWEEADPLSASYAEKAADGGVARYRLKDVWGPNRRRAFRHLPLLDGAVEVGGDGGWTLALVDCSTGEVAYWSLPRETAELFEAAEEGAAGGLESIGVFPLGGRWAAFSHAPARVVAPHMSSYDTSGPWDEADSYAYAIRVTEGRLADWRRGDASAADDLVAACRPVAEGRVTYSALLVAKEADGELLESLRAAYGEAAVDEWRSMPRMSVGDGFEDFIRRKWPEPDYAEGVIGAYASTGRVDYGWVD